MNPQLVLMTAVMTVMKIFQYSFQIANSNIEWFRGLLRNRINIKKNVTLNNHHHQENTLKKDPEFERQYEYKEVLLQEEK